MAAVRAIVAAGAAARRADDHVPPAPERTDDGSVLDRGSAFGLILAERPESANQCSRAGCGFWCSPALRCEILAADPAISIPALRILPSSASCHLASRRVASQRAARPPSAGAQRGTALGGHGARAARLGGGGGQRRRTARGARSAAGGLGRHGGGQQGWRRRRLAAAVERTDGAGAFTAAPPGRRDRPRARERWRGRTARAAALAWAQGPHAGRERQPGGLDARGRERQRGGGRGGCGRGRGRGRVPQQARSVKSHPRCPKRARARRCSPCLPPRSRRSRARARAQELLLVSQAGGSWATRAPSWRWHPTARGSCARCRAASCCRRAGARWRRVLLQLQLPPRPPSRRLRRPERRTVLYRSVLGHGCV